MMLRRLETLVQRIVVVGMLATVCLAPLALGGAPAAGAPPCKGPNRNDPGCPGSDDGDPKPIPICVAMDDKQFDGVSSDGAAYCNSKGDRVEAAFGSSRILGLLVSERSSRQLALDLSQALVCACSTRIDVSPVPDDVCDAPACSDVVPFVASELLSGFNFQVSIGDDLGALPLSCSHEDNARLRFSSGGEHWVLHWGPYDSFGGGGVCPGSSPIRLTRTGDDTWDFSTTGNHLACLYRQTQSPFKLSNFGATEYHGQFYIPFSGIAQAIESQTAPVVAQCSAQPDRERSGRQLAPVCTTIDPLNPVCSQ